MNNINDSNVSFDLYKVFYYVYQFKSITKAANFLCVSQPAITRHIKNLENNLRTTLIIRSRNGIELTDDGIVLYNKIKTAIEILNNIENSFHSKENEYNQVIRIIAGLSTIKKYLLKTLSQFNKKYPKIKFEISSYPYHESIQRLREGRADLVFLNLKEMPDNFNDLIIKKCYDVHDILVCSSEIKNQYPQEIKLLDLNNYPIICKAGVSVARNSIDKLFNKNGLTFIPRYELSNNWLIEEYVKLKLGIGLVTKEFILDDLKNGSLIALKTDKKLPKREIGYAIRKNCASYKVLTEFINELINNK